jgi:hypothetical protein
MPDRARSTARGSNRPKKLSRRSVILSLRATARPILPSASGASGCITISIATIRLAGAARRMSNSPMGHARTSSSVRAGRAVLLGPAGSGRFRRAGAFPTEAYWRVCDLMILWAFAGCSFAPMASSPGSARKKVITSAPPASCRSGVGFRTSERLARKVRDVLAPWFVVSCHRRPVCRYIPRTG